MQNFWLRFLFEGLAAIALSFILLTLGWYVLAEPMLRLAAESVKNVVMEDARAVLRFQWHVGLVSATPPLFALVADLVYRLRARAQPSWSRLAVCVAVPALGVGLGFWLHLWWVRAAIAAAANVPNGVEPMIGVASLSPALAGLKLGFIGGAAIALVNARRGTRR